MRVWMDLERGLYSTNETQLLLREYAQHLPTIHPSLRSLLARRIKSAGLFPEVRIGRRANEGCRHGYERRNTRW